MIFYSTDLYKFKKKRFMKLDRLIKKEKVDEVTREEELRSCLDQGKKDVYCVIFEDEGQRCLIWDFDENLVLDKYWELCDDI